MYSLCSKNNSTATIVYFSRLDLTVVAYRYLHKSKVYLVLKITFIR